MNAVDLPMFPLGSVLFPGQLLPLHIFEERYQEMLRHCLDGGNEFGVVLIERGHEVGGGDIRAQVGTVATILQAVEAEPGHWAVISAGTRRIRVERWCEDDPWPHAIVADFPDGVPADVAGDEPAAGVAVGRPGAHEMSVPPTHNLDDPESSAGSTAAESTAAESTVAEPTGDSAAPDPWTALRTQYRRLTALAAELSDEPIAVGVKVSDDPGLGSFQIAALSPLGSFDRQKVLSTSGVSERIAVLSGMLADAEDMLQASLIMAESPDDED